MYEYCDIETDRPIFISLYINGGKVWDLLKVMFVLDAIFGIDAHLLIFLSFLITKKSTHAYHQFPALYLFFNTFEKLYNDKRYESGINCDLKFGTKIGPYPV